jgi:hypothetical protein
MTCRGCLLLLLALACNAEKPAGPVEVSEPAGSGQATTVTKDANRPGTTTPSGKPDVAPAAPKIAEDEDLKAEERESNPYSETVTLKLGVTPQVKGMVTWGSKQVAKLAPGDMEAELTRPRGSGPVDLEIKAEGFMPFHTRLYSDRNDKVNVRLYRVEEAPGLLGYKRPAVEKTEKQEKKK